MASIDLHKIPTVSAGKQTGIILVNWNGWADTLECLESIFGMVGFGGPIVVCDNGSTDNSLKIIRDWAGGRICALPQSQSPQIRDLVISAIPKPIKLASLAPNDSDAAQDFWRRGYRLWIVPIGFNSGFAAANNVAIRLLHSIQDVGHFWLLNNDTVVTASAYKALLASVSNIRGPTIAGSVLAEYWFPNCVQARGATFNRYFSTLKHNGQGEMLEKLAAFDATEVVDYPIGASLIVNREYVDEIGLLSEEYFLYFEEMDWVIRGEGQATPFVVRDSIVFHKGGSATKSGRNSSERSNLADYYWIRGRIILSGKVSPIAFALTLSICSLVSFKRLLKSNAGAFVNVWRAIVHGCKAVLF